MTRWLVSVLLPLAVALPAALPAAASAATLAPETLTLRLPDLGPNFELVSDRCDERSGEERWWPGTLPSLARRFPHHGCVVVFAKSWSAPQLPPRPAYATSAAFAFADASGPVAALQRPRQIAAHVLHAKRRDLAPLMASAAVGDELRAFRFSGDPQPGVVVLWRSGPVLALVLAGGPASDRTTRAALQLATAQQTRIASPTPLLPSDLDDVEVPLDNPRLGVPVVWLGRTLPASDGRPALSLGGVDSSEFDPRAELWYGYRGHPSAVDIALSERRPLPRSLRGPARAPLCLRRYETGIPGLHAVIYGGPKPDFSRRRCGTAPPVVFGAAAFFRGVVVDIDGAACFPCAPRSAPFNSPAGMRAVLRALRVRPPRPLPTPAP
ncbi:MAG TPA: hypothetical protein VF250_07135 [Conexibacter sp.]